MCGGESVSVLVTLCSYLPVDHVDHQREGPQGDHGVVVVEVTGHRGVRGGRDSARGVPNLHLSLARRLPEAGASEGQSGTACHLEAAGGRGGKREVSRGIHKDKEAVCVDGGACLS